MRKQTRLVSSAFWSTKVTECGLVTSNGGHVHAMTRSSHLLASKMLFEEEKCISNIMRVKNKYSNHYFSCESST